MTERPALVVTRPASDSETLARSLRAAGHEVIAAPLLDVHLANGLVLGHERYQAIAASSANGPRALAANGLVPGLARTPVACVGPASARAARNAGFAHTLTASMSNVDGLTALIRQKFDTGNGPILYPCGKQVSGDLAGQLTAAGFTIERLPAYEARAATSLPQAIVTRLASGAPLDVLLYSIRTATVWCDLVTATGLTAAASQTRYLCLSAAIGNHVARNLGQTVRVSVANQPNDDGMIELAASAP